MVKQAYALVKALKSFKKYILHSQITAFMSRVSIKDMLCQPKLYGRWGKRITKIQEYYMMINPTKFIKIQGMAKLMV